MKRLLLPFLLSIGLASAADVELLIHLGLGDTESTVWDGSISVTPGTVREVSGYRFEQRDAIICQVLDHRTGGPLLPQ